ncbi:hypothetical protein AAG906_003194 [Vitis piasezkii]
MEETKTMKTPMSSSIKLDKDEKGKSIDSTMYRGMIVRRSRNLKSLPCFVFSTILLHSFKAFHISTSRDQLEQDFRPITSL